MGIVIEEWRYIERYPGYAISSTGKVRSLARKQFNGKGYFINEGRILKQHLDTTPKHRYMKVQLSIEGKTLPCWVHRLVCEAFHGPPPDPKSQACHKNDVGTDNRAENLEWGSQSYNERQKYSRRSLAEDEYYARQEPPAEATVSVADLPDEVPADWSL